MKYIEYTIDLSTRSAAERELLEQVLAYELADIGFDSFVMDEEQGVWRAYIGAVAHTDPTQIERAIGGLEEQYGTLSYLSAEIEDRDWNEEWEKNYYAPVEVIPGQLVVRASFHPARPELPMEIVIDPRMAFGTGNHATTAGMIRLMSDIEMSGAVVADMGCGSGILGIYAMKRGARACYAIDIDPWSVENALHNAQVNGVAIDVREGTADSLRELPSVDLLVANINRNIILDDLSAYLMCVRESGELLLSGFLGADVPLISEALEQKGWYVSKMLQPEGDWVALHCRRRS